jgi:hypothetical protein
MESDVKQQEQERKEDKAPPQHTAPCDDLVNKWFLFVVVVH